MRLCAERLSRKRAHKRRSPRVRRISIRVLKTNGHEIGANRSKSGKTEGLCACGTLIFTGPCIPSWKSTHDGSKVRRRPVREQSAERDGPLAELH